MNDEGQQTGPTDEEFPIFEYAGPTEGGINLHMMFTDFCKSGFTEDQALTLVAKIIAEANSSD